MSERPKECLENDLYKEEEKVLEEFEKKIKNNSGAIFVKDGAICPKTFLNEKIKILFILKEVNGGEYGNGVTDLRNFVFKNACGRTSTWNNVYRWVRTILESNSICWKDVENVDREQDREEILKKIAAMNVKKTAGKSSSKGSELKKATKANKEVLRKQIELYDADYIVCGYTHEYFDMLDYLTEEDKKTKGYVYFPEAVGKRKNLYSSYFIKKDKKQAIIYFYHPNAKINNQDLFNLLLKTLKETENKMK